MNDKDYFVKTIENLSEEVVRDVNHLIVQLGDSKKHIDKHDLQEMLDASSTTLFGVFTQDANEMIGMVTLIIYRIPFAKKAIVEDLVVDEKHRGKGLAKKLIETAIQKAKDENVAYIDLSSQPLRTAANSLYQRLGFVKRETNIYRIVLHQ